MALATKTMDYAQVLGFAMMLPLAERQRLSVEVLKEPNENSLSYWFNQVEPNQDITFEEIMEECDIVREKIYNETIKNRH